MSCDYMSCVRHDSGGVINGLKLQTRDIIVFSELQMPIHPITLNRKLQFS